MQNTIRKQVHSSASSGPKCSIAERGLGLRRFVQRPDDYRTVAVCEPGGMGPPAWWRSALQISLAVWANLWHNYSKVTHEKLWENCWEIKIKYFHNIQTVRSYITLKYSTIPNTHGDHVKSVCFKYSQLLIVQRTTLKDKKDIPLILLWFFMMYKY